MEWNAFTTGIDVLTRSRRPIGYIESSGEVETIQVLEELAKERKKTLKIWSITNHRRREETNPIFMKEPTPVDALDSIIRSTEDNVFYIMKDVHHFLDVKKNDVLFQRSLRDAYQRISCTHNSMLLVCPTSVDIPPGLDSEIYTIVKERPNKEEILKIFDTVIANLPKTISIEIEVEDRESISLSLLGLTFQEIYYSLQKTAVEHKSITKDTAAYLLDEKEQLIKKTGYATYIHPKESFDDIGEFDIAKEFMRKRRKAFYDAARKLKIPVPKGYLLCGAPGVGKSHFIKACGSYLGIPILQVSIGALLSKWQGDSERNLRELIKLAKKLAPCILFLDEIDKAFAGIGSGLSTSTGSKEDMLGYLLTWMQDKTEPVFVAASCNDVFRLPTALLRKGRFDEIFYVPLPSYEGRKDIFSIHIKKVDYDSKNFDLDLLSSETEGFSGAEIEAVVVSGLLDAYDNDEKLNTAYIRKARMETVPLSESFKEDLDRTIAFLSKRARWASSIKEPEKKKSKSSTSKLEIV